MKKLEELEMSPAPWTCDIDDEDQLMIYDAQGHDIGQSFACGVDANMMRSAPKLYKALYELVEAYEACNAHDGTCENCERQKMCKQDEERIISNAKSALAEAAGEGGEDGRN